MAGPITWKNVTDNTDYSAAAKFSRQSNQGFQNAFGQIEGMIEDQNTRVTKQNDDAFLNKINNMSVEDLQAGQADGSFAAMREGYGDMQSTDLLRGAVQKQVTTMQDRGVAEDAYVKGELVKDNQGLTQEISSLLNSGTKEGVAQARTLMGENQDLLAQMGQLDSFSKDALTNQRSNRSYRRGLMMEDRGDKKFYDEQDANNLLQDIMNNNPESEAVAFSQFSQQAAEMGLGSGAVNAAKAALGQQYQATYGMTGEQSEQHSTFTASEAAGRESRDLQISQKYDEDLKALRLPGEGSSQYSLLDYAQSGGPDPVAILDELQYDPDTIGEYVPTIKEDFVKRMNAKGDETWDLQDPRIDALLVTAAKMQGKADDDWWSTDNVNINKIVAQMDASSKTLSNLRDKQKQAEELRRQRDNLLNDSSNLERTRINDSKEQFLARRRLR